MPDLKRKWSIYLSLILAIGSLVVLVTLKRTGISTEAAVILSKGAKITLIFGLFVFAILVVSAFLRALVNNIKIVPLLYNYLFRGGRKKSLERIEKFQADLEKHEEMMKKLNEILEDKTLTQYEISAKTIKIFKDYGFDPDNKVNSKDSLGTAELQ